MKNIISILALSSIASTSQAAMYKLDQQHMEVGFSVKHLMVSNVKGRFDKVSGSFDYDAKSGTIKDLMVEIDTNSINTNEVDRDKHLKADDFFAADKFQKMTFKADKGQVLTGGKLSKITGTLTIRDKSKPITLEVTHNGETEMMGVKKLGFTATGKINRKDFGMTFNKVLDNGGVAVSDEVKILIEGEANMAVADTKPAKK